MMCEYAHAMGNGPGDLEDYFELIHRYDGMCGGFIWEWCDHAVKTESGFLYGGDFGEELHDGNFCVDGLVSPNRIPHPGLREFKMYTARPGFRAQIGKRERLSLKLYGFYRP